MTELEKAARQALEALEKLGCLAFKNIPCRCSKLCDSYVAAIALRQALADNALDKMAENARELGIQIQPAQDEPVAVPQLGDGVFWCDTCKSVQEHPDHAENDIWCKGQATWIQGPFYTSPPKREPLMDEQLKPLIQKAMMYYGHNPDHWTLTAGAGFCILARAIEAAHGIKGDA